MKCTRKDIPNGRQMMKILQNRWVKQLFIFAIIAIACTSCSDPLTPVTPRWDADLNVPLIAETYTMEDLLSQDSTLEIIPGDDNILILRKGFDVESILLGDRITLSDNSYSYHQELGELNYDIPELISRDILVRDLFPTMQVRTGPVDRIANPSIAHVAVDARDYFEEMTFKEGLILITLKNNMPVPLSFPAPALLTDENGATLASFVVSGILLAGETRELPAYNLKGKTLKDDMSLSITVATPGSEGHSVTVLSTHGLHVTAAIVNTEILSALAYLPSQQSLYQEKVDITNNDGSNIASGKLRHGRMIYDVFNHIPVGAEVTLTVHGIITPAGTALVRNFHVDARKKHYMEIDLTGSVLEPSQGKYLEYSVLVKTDAAEQQPVRIHAEDSIAGTATLFGMILESVDGTLATRQIQVDQTQHVNFDFTSRLSGEIEYSKAKMWTVLKNSADVAVQVDNLRITGLLSGSSTSAYVNVPYQRINGNNESTVLFADNEVLNFLNTFSGKFPDQLKVQGSVTLNPDAAPGRAASDDKITGTIFVELPMQFTMKSGVINDTSAMTMSKENQQRFEDVNSGSITFEMENHLPADMILEASVLDQHYNVLLEPRAIDGSAISVPSAEVDTEGRVYKATTQQTQIEFKQEEFKKLVLSKWIRVRLRMNAESARNMAFRTTDYIKVRAFATLNVNSKILD
jgi:hypothetical protein